MHRDIEPESSARRSSVRGGRSVIAVIGIDRYVEWPGLHNAVSDALGASRLFMRLGFVEATPALLNEAATGEAMRRLVTDDLATRLLPDDSFVLFFAGHGHTHTTSFGDVSVKTGCVIPVDATRPGGHLSATWLQLDNWLRDIARLPPRHILVIVDACYSGMALSSLHKWRDEASWPAMDLEVLQTRRSRRIITSALDDQRAMDGGPYPGHSLFTGCLIEGLSGGLAAAGRRVATGREIGQYLQRRVGSYPQSTQTPDFSTFELDDRGDIIMPILHEVPHPWYYQSSGGPPPITMTVPATTHVTSVPDRLLLVPVPSATASAGTAYQPAPRDERPGHQTRASARAVGIALAMLVITSAAIVAWVRAGDTGSSGRGGQARVLLDASQPDASPPDASPPDASPPDASPPGGAGSATGGSGKPGSGSAEVSHGEHDPEIVEVDVLSSPPGAKIFLDRIDTGKSTPSKLVLPRKEGKLFSITLKLKGYEPFSFKSIDMGESSQQRAELVKVKSSLPSR